MTKKPKEPQLDAFDPPPPAHVPKKRKPRAVDDLKGMIRHPHEDTSIDAASRVEPHNSRIQTMILLALKEHGPMCDGEIELLPEFIRMGETTASKRRTELCQKGLVRRTGERRVNPKNPKSKMLVWELVE